MNESAWYTKQRTQMEELLWKMQQQSQKFQHFHDQTRSVWNDDASSDIRMRYLSPYEQDIQETITSLTQQLSTLQESDAKIDTAYTCKTQVDQFSHTVQRLVANINQDIAISRSNYSAFEEEHRAAKAKLPEVMNLIQKANSACPK
jgi:chromosome segregation ATPase